MIILIDGPSHSGKTRMAQRLMKKLLISYQSMDHLKMGLYHSKHLSTIFDDELVTNHLFPIYSEMIKTILENEQSIIIEGIYFNENWAKMIRDNPLIRYSCIVFSENYIKESYESIIIYRNIVEKRIDTNYPSLDDLLKEHQWKKWFCIANNLEYIEIQNNYELELDNYIEKWDE